MATGRTSKGRADAEEEETIGGLALAPAAAARHLRATGLFMAVVSSLWRGRGTRIRKRERGRGGGGKRSEERFFGFFSLLDRAASGRCSLSHSLSQFASSLSLSFYLFLSFKMRSTLAPLAQRGTPVAVSSRRAVKSAASRRRRNVAPVASSCSSPAAMVMMATTTTRKKATNAHSFGAS